MKSRNLRRRGLGTVEWICVAAALLIATVVLITTMGQQVDSKLNDTAQDVANPAALTQRFGN